MIGGQLLVQIEILLRKFFYLLAHFIKFQLILFLLLFLFLYFFFLKFHYLSSNFVFLWFFKLLNSPIFLFLQTFKIYTQSLNFLNPSTQLVSNFRYLFIESEILIFLSIKLMREVSFELVIVCFFKHQIIVLSLFVFIGFNDTEVCLFFILFDLENCEVALTSVCHSRLFLQIDALA